MKILDIIYVFDKIKLIMNPLSLYFIFKFIKLTSIFATWKKIYAKASSINLVIIRLTYFCGDWECSKYIFLICLLVIAGDKL